MLDPERDSGSRLNGFRSVPELGTAGLSAVLVVSKDGLVLLDGALPQSVLRIEANIRALGFRVEDIRWVLNSHAHFDHAGGIAALARDAGARVGASLEGAKALRAGAPPREDPQAGFGKTMRFAKVARAEGLNDGAQVRAGELVITAHHTPGHTPGGTTWTWRSCEGERCVDVVYADRLNPVSAPGFHFSRRGTPPGRIEQFQKGIATVSALPCDVILSVHPDFSETFEKLARRESGLEANPFIAALVGRASATLEEAT